MVRKPNFWRRWWIALVCSIVIGNLLDFVESQFLIGPLGLVAQYALVLPGIFFGRAVGFVIADWLDDNDDWPDQLKKRLGSLFTPKVSYA